MSCYSTAATTQYTTITTDVVSTSFSYSTSSIPGSATTYISSTCAPPQVSGNETGTPSCTTVTSVSSIGGGVATVQVPITITVTTASVSPLSTVFSTTCSSGTTAVTTTQTTSQSTVSTSQTIVTTSTLISTTSTTTGSDGPSTVTTVIQSSVTTSAAASTTTSSSDNTAVIVGAAVGGGIGLILVVLLLCLLCRRRRRNDDGYSKADQQRFDRNAMVRPTPYPYPGLGSDSGSFAARRSGRPQSGSSPSHDIISAFNSPASRDVVPVFSAPASAHDAFSSPPSRDIIPVPGFSSPHQASTLSTPSSYPSSSFTQDSSVPLAPGMALAAAAMPMEARRASPERPAHTRVGNVVTASEGIRSPSQSTASSSSPSRAGHPLPVPPPPRNGSGPGPGGAVRSPPISISSSSEKAHVHLHPDRGLTYLPPGAEAPRSGQPSWTAAAAAAQRDGAAVAAVPAWRGPKNGAEQRARLDAEGYRDMVGYGDSYVQGAAGETGGSKAAAPGLPGAGDRLHPRGTGEKRKAVPWPSTGMTREKGRRRNEREEPETEAPPAYWA
ncbi:hypothetical protein V8D89_008204 [Ganoderma adspersum]